MADTRRIWWLASYPKSGNTWVRMFLNCYVTGFPVNINAPFQYAAGDLAPAMYQLTSARPITEMDDSDVVYYRMAVLKNFIYTRASEDVALKTHHAKIALDDIPLIPPKLSKGALYIVRDPRDVVVSFADHTGKTIDGAVDALANPEQCLVKDTNKLFHVLTSWSGHVDSWTAHNDDVPVGIVKYEDLRSDPKAAFRDVLRILGFPEPREDRFQFALDQTTFSNLKRIEATTGFRELGKGDVFFRTGSAGTWKNTLSPEQIERIENNHRHTMERVGYEVSITEPAAT